MSHLLKRGAALLATLTVAATVQAHDGMHGPGGEYDIDEDAALSLAEYTAYLKDQKQDVTTAKTRFEALDKDKDGVLSSAEFIRGLVAEKSK